MKYTEEDLMNSWGTAKWAHANNALYGQSYTFEVEGVSPCHLPMLVGRRDDEPPCPKKDEDFYWACDMHQPCAGALEEMRAQARKWKARFPQHEVVVYSRTCLDAQGKWDDDAIYDEFFVEEVK